MKVKFKLPDLIQKLARLANNNPHENEANAAARRVCQMLAEKNFEFTLDVPNTEQKPLTWNDVVRSTEPEFRSRPSTSSGFGFDWATPPRREKRKLRCKTCKQEKETTLIGAPELFECDECQWTAYKKKF